MLSNAPLLLMRFPLPCAVSIASWWLPTDVFAEFYTKLRAAGADLISGSIVFLIFLVVALLGRRFITYSTLRVKADAGVVLLLSRVYYYGVLVLGSITALSTAKLDVSALVTGLGLTGFALGFALKDVLSNLLAGIMLLLYRPFNIGDHILMGTYEGTIETIRMRDTVLRSYDNRLVIIPNTKLITEVVVNNRMARVAQDSFEVILPAHADANSVRMKLLQALAQNPVLSGRVDPVLIFSTLNDQSTRIEGRFWYDPHRADKAVLKTEIANQITNIVSEPTAPITNQKSNGQTSIAAQESNPFETES